MPPKQRNKSKASSKTVQDQVSSKETDNVQPPPVVVNSQHVDQGVSISLTSAMKDPLGTAKILLSERQYFWLVAAGLILFQAVLGVAIILKIPYTKIDWDAYMQQVDMFLAGEKDYSKIEGETGPLVYPALHLYIYALFHRVLPAHGRERPAQFIFLGVEALTLLIVSGIYWCAGRLKHVPQWLLIPLVLSKRSHSIYLLRLFNDPLAMVFLYSAVLLFMNAWWKMGTLFYALAIGVKMNILLFLPGLLVILYQYRSVMGTLDSLVIIVLTHVALPAMFFNDESWQMTKYYTAAFDFSREFLYKWTVNWRFLPENVFLSKSFSNLLLAGHVVLLVAFGWSRWNPVPGGAAAVIARGLKTLLAMFKPTVLPGQLNSAHIPLVLFTCNLIGMTFARSLHYQFYAWYFHQLPLLLWLGGAWGQPMLILGFMGLIERSWLTYPSTSSSSLTLLAVHVLILAGLWVNGPKASPSAPAGKAGQKSKRA